MMRRGGGILLFALLVLVGSIGSLHAQDGGDLPARDAWEIVGVIERHADTGELRLRWTGAPPPPLPGETPAATATPTNTPRPTATATATPTATPTVTPGVPSPTPDTGPIICTGTVNADNLNVRSGPYLTILGQVHAGDTLRLDARALDRNGETWYRIWWDVDSAGEEIPGWVHSDYIDLSDTNACAQVPEVNLGYARVGLGFWVGPGANVPELLAAGDVLSEGGYAPTATVYGNDAAARELAAHGWQIAYRPWYGDCPDVSLPADVSARVRVADAERLSATIPHRWLVLSNECQWPSTAYLVEWLSGVVDEAGRRGMGAGLVPLVWASGQPELDVIPALRVPLTQLARLGGAWGLNVYPVAEDRALCARDAYTTWTTWRWEMYRDALPPNLPMVVTEAASGWGAGVTATSDYGCWWQSVRDDFDAATLWYVSGEGLHPWGAANLRGRLVSLARGVR